MRIGWRMRRGLVRLKINLKRAGRCALASASGGLIMLAASTYPDSWLDSLARPGFLLFVFSPLSLIDWHDKDATDE